MAQPFKAANNNLTQQSIQILTPDGRVEQLPERAIPLPPEISLNISGGVAVGIGRLVCYVVGGVVTCVTGTAVAVPILCFSLGVAAGALIYVCLAGATPEERYQSGIKKIQDWLKAALAACIQLPTEKEIQDCIADVHGLAVGYLSDLRRQIFGPGPGDIFGGRGGMPA